VVLHLIPIQSSRYPIFNLPLFSVGVLLVENIYLDFFLVAAALFMLYLGQNDA
jgi:hypothetical protein